MILSEAERKVLKFLVERREADVDHSGYAFAGIASDTGLDRKEVRLACRSLATKGFAEFHRVLWDDEDGTPCGAGYSATFDGQRALTGEL